MGKRVVEMEPEGTRRGQTKMEMSALHKRGLGERRRGRRSSKQIAFERPDHKHPPPTQKWEVVSGKEKGQIATNRKCVKP